MMKHGVHYNTELLFLIFYAVTSFYVTKFKPGLLQGLKLLQGCNKV